jgi:hypothetical protein
MISSRPALPRTTRSSSPLPPQPPLLPLPPRTRHNPAHHSTSKLLRISRFRTVSVTKGVSLVHPQFSWLLTRCLPKPFRMRTSIKCACNSFRMNTSKKTGEGAWWHEPQHPGCAVIQIGSLDSNLHSPYSLRLKTSDPATPGIDRWATAYAFSSRW